MNEFNSKNLIDLHFETAPEKLSITNNNDLIAMEDDNNKNLLLTTAKPTTAMCERTTAAATSITIKDEGTNNKDLMMDGSFISTLKCTLNTTFNNDDDPFDKMEREALNKARQIKNQMECKAKLGKLLSLSDDNDDDDDGNNNEEQLTKELDNINKHHSSKLPQVIVNCENGQYEMWTTENANGSLYSQKLKKSTDYQKNLLKLSLTNSAFGNASPLNKLIPLDNALNTPVSSMFLKNLDFDEPLLAAESPLKLIDDDDDDNDDNNDDLKKNSNDNVDIDVLLDCPAIPKANLVDEKKFEADLEMLKIPILEELSTFRALTNDEIKLNSPTINTNFKDENKSGKGNQTIMKDEDILSKVVPSLEAIKAKLECKRNQNKQADISGLINHIKEIMITDESVMSQEKKQQVTELLDNLKEKIIKTNKDNTSSEQQFDNQHDNGDINIKEETPQCMVSSTSTYDGEIEPQDELKRPEILSSSSMENLSDIKSLSSTSSSPRPSIQSDQTDLNEIVEKLTKVFTKREESSTVILVMKTPTSITKDKIQQQCQQIDDLENIVTRRRSQSLSVCDTIKILQFPSAADKSIPSKAGQQKLKDNRYSMVSSPKSTTSGQFLRRNSFSGGYLKKPELSKQIKSTPTTNNINHKSQQQQQSVTRSVNMPVLRPDPKRKLKLPTESIMKAAGPLKATIPIKKLVPSKPKTKSPITAIHTLNSASCNSNGDNPMAVASTPLQIKRNLSLNAVGNPKAFSTPHHSISNNISAAKSGTTSNRINSTNATGTIKKPINSQVLGISSNSRSSLVPSSGNFATSKRRTTSDLKIKSNGKITKTSARITTGTATTATTSVAAAAVAAAAAAAIGVQRFRPTSSSTSTAINSRNSISNPSKNHNIPSTRLSMSQARLASKNKENKRP